jgi:hypothetical protein
MTKTLIKVYFNNGCTTLAYTDTTTVDDLIRLVIKGRLSANELRYRQCFKLRSTKFAAPFKDFDNLTETTTTTTATTANSSLINSKIEDFFWLRGDLTIPAWLHMIASSPLFSTTDHWKLQLKVRYISSDLTEVKFKDPCTFSYFYEQVSADFAHYVAPTVTEPHLMPLLLELGCLEMRRTFQHMMPDESKVDYEYLEKAVGLHRFFSDFVLQQHKPKQLKKLVVKGLKSHQGLSEAECMLRFLDRVLPIWRYNEESYACNVGSNLQRAEVAIAHADGLSIRAVNARELKTLHFNRIVQITTELDHHSSASSSKTRSWLRLKLAGDHGDDSITFRLDRVNEAANMASLIEGYCLLYMKQTASSSLWIHIQGKFKILAFLKRL